MSIRERGKVVSTLLLAAGCLLGCGDMSDGGDDAQDGADEDAGDGTLLGGTCFAEYFSGCFDFEGTCVEESRSSTLEFTDVRATVWSNGAEAEFFQDDVTGDAEIRLSNSDGDVCATGTGAAEQDGSTIIVFNIDDQGDLNIQDDAENLLQIRCAAGEDRSFEGADRDQLYEELGWACP